MSSNTVVIITDAWEPQVNGVVTTYKNIIANLPEGWNAIVIHPDYFKNFPNPLYKGIRISIATKRYMRVLIEEQLTKANVKFHIATEGPIGCAAKRVMDKMGIEYSTAYHTKFPEFFKEMYYVPVKWTKWYFNWFHSKSKFVLMSSQSVANRFPQWNCKVIGKGYDSYFTFSEKSAKIRPMLLYVGRVSSEKNIEAFCDLKIDALKIIIGDGPTKHKLEKKYDDVCFLGYKFGPQLAKYYKQADCLVFPSKTDTYGIVVLESMACGTPVAAYPVDGAIDQIKNGINGYIDDDLEVAVKKSIQVSRETTYNSVKDISWKNSAKQFIEVISLLGE